VLARAFWVALVVALVTTPLYALAATAQFSLRSFWSFDALFPLLGKSAFGHGYLRLELLLALFAVAAGIALWLDRAVDRRRTIAELVSQTGAWLAAAAVLLAPGASGHADQTSPRWLALSVDWLHLSAAAVWAGGLLGLVLIVRNIPALVVAVPRFSVAAFSSVVVLLGTGIVASVLHLPTLATLWDTSYGQTIVVKAALLLAALALGAVNFLRTSPSLRVPDPPATAGAALRRLAGGETLLVAGAVLAAAILSSLAPPPKALAGIGRVDAHAGPGRVVETVDRNGYHLALRVDPNRAAVPNTFSVELTRHGARVRGADVTLRFTMLDMEMQAQEYRLPETAPGAYAKELPALVMVGRWGLALSVTPPGATTPFDVFVLDKADG
jgi:copper transport protein